MKSTVYDCLQLDALKGAKYTVGSPGLMHSIKSVSMVEAALDEESLVSAASADALLITALFGAEDDLSRQLHIISSIAQANAAGLLVVGSERLKGLDPALYKAAERARIALIFMPKEDFKGYGETINQIVGRILYGDNFGNHLISNTIFHLLDFERHSSFESALQAAAVNNNFQVVLMNEAFSPIFSVETRHQVSIADAISLGRKREIDGGGIYNLIDVSGVLTYWGPVKIDDEKHYMFIVDNDDMYTAADITKLAEIIELAMNMWKYTPKRDATSEFIKALRRGNRELATSLHEEAEIAEERILGVFYVNGSVSEEIMAALDDFRKENSVSVLRMIEGEERFGVMVSERDSSDGYVEEIAACTKLYNLLKEDKGTRIFHMTRLDGIEGACDAFRQISDCWSLAQTVFPYKRVFSKYELALVSNCLNIQLSGGFVKKNYLELLDPFQLVGSNKGRQLLETLETFVLDAGMNSGRTSEFLGIHTNTVQYRLKKINELLGVEVTGNRVLPGLTVALALKRLERIAR